MVLFSLLFAAAAAAPSRAQPVQGDVVSIGFQGGVDEKWLTREGRWTPILLQVQAQGSEHFQGELRIERSDLDGDLVGYTARPVALTGNEGIKRVWCYVPPTRLDHGRPLTVDVISDRGFQVSALTAPAFGLIGNDTQVILDVSARPLTALKNQLDSGANGYNDPRAVESHGYYLRNCYATLQYRDLPDRWIGLEAADVMIWDDPDIDKLSPAQVEALVDWVRNGGQLVLGIGATWPALSKSALAAILPIQGDQPPIEVRSLPQFLVNYALDAQAAFKHPVVFAMTKPRDNAVVLQYELMEDNRPAPLLTLGYCGSGRVITCATRLRDLFEAAPRVSFLHKLVDFNQMPKAYLEAEAKNGNGLTQLLESNLYPDITDPVEFRTSAGQLVLIVGAFVAAYILLATLGAWTWLQRSSLAQLNWPVFAAFAVIGSVLSLTAVGVSRGVVSRLHSLTVYDLEAGNPAARAIGWFGYRSPTRRDVDFALSGTTAFLRPMTPSPNPAEQQEYATPMRYAALPDKARLERTKLRATLKQFEGHWETNLSGAVLGQLAISRASGQVTPDSWLKCDLDMRIASGYLLYIDPRVTDVSGDVAGMPSGLTDGVRRGKKYRGYNEIAAGANVLAVPTGPLKQAERTGSIASKLYSDFAAVHDKWAQAENPDPNHEPQLPTLWSLQNTLWRRGLSSVAMSRADLTRNALAMASTRALYLATDNDDFNDSRGWRFSVDNLMQLDVTHWMTRGQAVLLLFSDEPGPAALQVDGVAKSASEGMSLVRVRIPVTYVP